MFSSRKLLQRTGTAAAALLVAGAAVAQSSYPGVGRAATPKEIAAWDIDVRPDFKGLPKGSGTVAKGTDVWEAKCAHCHGVFGESNEVFSPLVGGTSAEDVKTGRVAKLTDPSFPGRTTLMKVSSVSTLWDYINRAMPWTEPKSLKPDEVYSVVAYLLNLGNVIPENFVLSDKTIAEAQARMPNRNGMTLDHGMWPSKSMKTAGKPDVKAVACMKDCAKEVTIASDLPEFARNQHGNLAEQNRPVGQQRGADTTKPAPKQLGEAAAAGAVAVAVAAAPAAAKSPMDILKQNACVACHAVDAKLVGPSFKDVAAKYANRADASAYLAGKIKSGGSGVWGAIPMPAQALPEADAAALGKWLAEGAK